MFSSIGATPNLNLKITTIQASAGPALLQGLNTMPYQSSISGGFCGAVTAFNPGGLGSLQPATSSGMGRGSRTDGYIQGLEDALKQVRGPKSRPDEERIRALLQAARQNREQTPGPVSPGYAANPLAAPCGQVGAPTFQSGGASPAGPQGSWQQGYTEGIEAALQQIRGKDSKPDENRVRALLQGARQAQSASSGQPAGANPQPALNALMPLQPQINFTSLFSGCRTGSAPLF
jgi:hypothetical protein